MNYKAKPFLKWAGGKRQLIPDLVSRLPENVRNTGIIRNYIEPFVGGGSFFFYLQNNFSVREAYISDINKDLILAYQTVQKDVSDLLSKLESLNKEYKNLQSENSRSELFYNIRQEYNNKRISFDKYDKEEATSRTAQLIFLNRTCFNGLFRLNKKGEFNVPFGKYKNPTILDEDNLLSVSEVLQNVVIKEGDFELSEPFANKYSLIYLDPPYRPINQTSSFTSYSKEDFTDEDQKRLAEYYERLSKKGCNLILSNSDPKNTNRKDTFFDDLYKKFHITRVRAKRMINSKAEGRGEIFELMITNYKYD